jgi:adenosylhomocysteine nucleosidase
MPSESTTLVCFAVKHETGPFKSKAREHDAKILITGMGKENARRSIEAALAGQKPGCVLTCGFAGALNRDLKRNEILFSDTSPPNLAAIFQGLGGREARFHCAERIASTAEEKRVLFQKTNADAVEMESGIIHKCCAKAGVPCATVRVVLDTAEEDLPLDFNPLMTARYQINYLKLAQTLLKGPEVIPSLLFFQKQCDAAARKLSDFLGRTLVMIS